MICAERSWLTAFGAPDFEPVGFTPAAGAELRARLSGADVDRLELLAATGGDPAQRQTAAAMLAALAAAPTPAGAAAGAPAPTEREWDAWEAATFRDRGVDAANAARRGATA